MGLTSDIYSLPEIANFTIALAFILSGVLSVVFIIKGGFLFIFSKGDDEKLKEAVHTIRYSIIGFLVVVVSAFIVKFIGEILFGIDLLDYLTFDKIKLMYEKIIEVIRLDPTTNPSFEKGLLD
jgi:hypothetical protein